MLVSIPGTIVPKARPRVTKRGTAYMPKAYTEWKEITIRHLRNECTPILDDLVSVDITLYGKHSRRGDLDNSIGSCLDALVQAGILPDDSMTHVVSVSGAIYHSKEPPRYEIKITPHNN